MVNLMLENQQELFKVVGVKIILLDTDYYLMEKLDNKKEILNYYKRHLEPYILLVSIHHKNTEELFKVHIYQELAKLKDY